MKKIFLSLLMLLPGVIAYSQASLLKFEPVSFSKVNITDNFWKPKMTLVATKTLNACIYQTETATPRIKNFINVAKNDGQKHQGIFFDDSDVYKAMEAMAYSLKNNPNPELEKKADEWIDIIASAQQPDGYLNTYFTLEKDQKRWSDMDKHEDYCAGHMIEAAIAYFNTTGKRKFLDVAIRFANHIDSTFRLQNRHWVSGHEEIEIALVKLYKNTANKKYLDLADWYLQQRGHGYYSSNPATQDYYQDKLPLKEQTQITGHAVRAMYLYTGAADVGATKNDTAYMHAMKLVWEDVVHRNMYITGGIGSSGKNEGFTIDYDLPNEQAYCETCASVGMIFWNQRMNTLTGDAKYTDVLERSLYNGALSGLSLSGDRFFYGNPLASTGNHKRSEWFGCACCPSNISRLISSLGDYVYAKNETGIWVNLFVGSDTKILLGKNEVALKMETNYPIDGQVKILVTPSKTSSFKLHIRKPGWCSGTAVPGGLYNFDAANSAPSVIKLSVNGKPFIANEEKGYFILDRTWKKGDVVEYSMSMEAKRVVARNEVLSDKGRVALQRGPLVYCVEGADNNGKALDFIFPGNAAIIEKPYSVVDEKVVALTANVPIFTISTDGLSARTIVSQITAIPYYSWCNRGSNQMQVWLPTRIIDVKANY
jgi:DUF1680 family protein